MKKSGARGYLCEVLIDFRCKKKKGKKKTKKQYKQTAQFDFYETRTKGKLHAILDGISVTAHISFISDEKNYVIRCALSLVS